MIPRQIVGPQDQFERTRRAESARHPAVHDAAVRGAAQIRLRARARPWRRRARSFEPAVVDLTVPAGVLYALWVLTRRAEAADAPARTRRPTLDHSNPHARLPQAQAGGRAAVHRLEHRRHELWVTAEDARQHMTIPGTTGAGKTTAILSLLINALAQGSGFVLVDGKADRDLFGKVLALARRFGRDDDVRVLNFMVALGLKDSNTFNPFAIGNADAIRELLASQLGEQAQNDANGVFRERAVALIGTIAPVLVWLRDHKGVPLNIEVIRFSIELRWIWKLAMEKIVLLRDPETGDADRTRRQRRDPGGHHLAAALLSRRTAGLRSVDAARQAEGRRAVEAARLRAVLLHRRPSRSSRSRSATSSGSRTATSTCATSCSTAASWSVNLPALENSDATLAALGKLVVASLRGMMAQLLGASLEGDYTEADKPGMGPAPFPVVLDELGLLRDQRPRPHAGDGRGLNIMLHARLPGSLGHLGAARREDRRRCSATPT